MTSPCPTRRQALGLIAAAAATPVSKTWADETHDIAISGAAPSLSFRMQATPDGRIVTQADFQGVVTMLYFGYTFCPDVCPLTLQNALSAVTKMGGLAQQVRLLFVTVDPARDTTEVLAGYTKAFGPEVVGLRGDADALERLTRRYRIAWSVTPSEDPRQYEVTHSAAVYVFDRQLNARFLVPSMASQKPDINGLAVDLARLVNEPPSRFGWLRGLA